MINQLRMKNAKYEVYGKPEDIELFKRWRRDNPKFKYARIKEILQARPDKVDLYSFYIYGCNCAHCHKRDKHHQSRNN